MLKNFFKTAFRNIIKYKAYSFINFVGLTSGLALSLLIITYVLNEVSYDQFHTHIDRLYRFSYTVPNGLQIASIPPPIAPKLKDFYPEVEETARWYGRNVSVSLPGQAEAFEENNVYFVDSAATKMFSFEFVKGNPKRALHDKFTVLVNEDMATKYFGDKDPIGETLILSGRQSFKVIGVVKDFPENSHLRFNMLIPYDDMYDLEDAQTEQVLRNNFEKNFVISHSYTYVLLKEGSTPDHINSSMGEFLKKYADPNRIIGQIFTLMPVRDIHLQSTLLVEPTATNSMTNILLFVGVGLLTLLIAAINYINLSTAQSFTRIKEIGIRKILGSMKHQLIIQFLAESFLFCFAALLISFLVFDFSLPWLNQLTNKHLVFTEVIDGKLIFFSLFLLIVITALAGGYPAYFVTRFQSVNALKGAGSGAENQFLRKSLVVFQLAIACMLLSGSLLIVKQLDYLSSRPLGFQKEHVITIPLFSQNLNGFFQQTDSTFRMRLQSFRDRIEMQSGVKQTTLSSGTPGAGAIYRGTTPEGSTPEDNILAANMSVDYDFKNAYGLEMIAGRWFNEDYGTDVAESFVVNETAVQEFKWESPEKAIGKTINREGKKGQVVGVIKDFNFAALTTAITALIFSIDQNQFNTLSIRFENSNVQTTMDLLAAEWNQTFPEKSFEYYFLNETLNQQYSNYQNFGRIIQSFTAIAILIACLGVYGLVLFTVQRKVKEIGVRKVLGASVQNILMIVYRDFALLIILGFVLAVPISYYFMSQWFDNFIYHTSIDALTYLISLIFILVIVSATISYQAIRAAMANPVKSLRSE